MKKIFKLSVMAMCIAGLLVSCSGEKAPKQISFTSTEFQDGDLSNYIEIVNEPVEFILIKKTENAFLPNIFSTKVKIRLTRENPKFKQVDANDLEFNGWSIATISAIDKNEENIMELSLKDEDRLKLKKLLQSPVNTEETFTFRKEYYDDDIVNTWFDNTVSFTPNRSCDISIAGEDVDLVESLQDVAQEVGKTYQQVAQEVAKEYEQAAKEVAAEYEKATQEVASEMQKAMDNFSIFGF